MGRSGVAGGGLPNGGAQVWSSSSYPRRPSTPARGAPSSPRSCEPDLYSDRHLRAKLSHTGRLGLKPPEQRRAILQGAIARRLARPVTSAPSMPRCRRRGRGHRAAPSATRPRPQGGHGRAAASHHQLAVAPLPGRFVRAPPPAASLITPKGGWSPSAIRQGGLEHSVEVERSTTGGSGDRRPGSVALVNRGRGLR